MMMSRAEVTKLAEMYIGAHGGSVTLRRTNKLSS